MAFKISFTNPETHRQFTDNYLRIESVSLKKDHSGNYASIMMVLFYSENVAKVSKGKPELTNIEIRCEGDDYDTYFKSPIDNFPNLSNQQKLALTIEQILRKAAYLYIKSLNPKEKDEDKKKVKDKWLHINFKDDAVSLDND